MKSTLFFCLLCFCAFAVVQSQPHEYFKPAEEDIPSPVSSFGKYFTPKGEMRALVIYVNFEEEYLDPQHHDNLRFWPLEKEFPAHKGKSVIDEHQNLRWGFQQQEEFEKIDTTDFSVLENLSAYYYVMSQGQFRMYFETLKHPETQQAISIKINPEGVPSSAAGRAELNKRVFQKIRALYPQDYDWSRFDNRKNNPNYKFDNAEKPTKDTYADYTLDFVILLFRNHNKWNPHPNGSTKGVGWRKAIMGTGAAREIIGYQNNKPILVGNEGLRIFDTRPHFFKSLELLIHEIGHGMISMPHINRANKAEGDYLFYPYGWGMMDSYAGQFATANAWERWYAGWTEITQDISSKQKDTLFELDDFLYKGESARIKLPHREDEYIWLEHRKDTANVYYQHTSKRKDRYGNPYPKHQPGLYAFVEKMASSRNQTFGTNVGGTNGMKVIYGKGNYDYVFHGFENRHYAWDNDVFMVTNQGPNAYGGQHEAMYFRHDFNDNDRIEQKTGSNGAGGKYIDGKNIYEIDDEVVLGHHMRNTSILLPKISAFTNPPLTHFQKMDWRANALAPVLLHSLSISQQLLPNGNLQIKVDYEDGKIEENFRMTGPIVLPTGEEITLAKEKELLLNKSKTLNRVKAVEGSFIANSYLRVKGKLTLEEGASFIVDEASHVIFEAQSELVLKKGAKIILLNQSSLDINENAKVKMEAGAEIVR